MIVCSETCLSHVSLSYCLAPVSLSCNTHHRFLCHTIIQTSLNSPLSPPLTIIITFTIHTTLVFSTKNLVFLPYICHCLEHCPSPPQPTFSLHPQTLSPLDTPALLFSFRLAAPNTNAKTVEFGRHTTIFIPAPTAGYYSSDTSSTAPYSALHPALNYSLAISRPFRRAPQRVPGSYRK